MIRGMTHLTLGQGRRTGVRVKEDVKKDDLGFDDIGDFWESDELKPSRRSSISSSASSTGGTEHDFDYDTTGSITEDEEPEEDEEVLLLFKNLTLN